MKLSPFLALATTMATSVKHAFVRGENLRHEVYGLDRDRTIHGEARRRVSKTGKTGNTGDLGIRFNKFDSIDGTELPILGPADFPMDGAVADQLKISSNAVSVMTKNDIELRGVNVGKLIQKLGGCPTMPNKDPNHNFWDEFRSVLDAQKHRESNGTVEDVMVLPKIWSGYNISEVAKAVHDEYPGYHQAKLVEEFFKEGVKIDYNILPFRSASDFVGGPVRMAAINTWAISKVSAVNFRAKWICGRARPEEVAWSISTGVIPKESVPDDVYDHIMQMDLQSPTECTAYEEGCPRHPAWPAMHSAASSFSLWAEVVFNLTPEQSCQARLVDYAVSYARKVAGVHYDSDNVDGLNLGQMVLAASLADHLSERYGANRFKVASKVRAKRFNWKHFDPEDCRSSA